MLGQGAASSSGQAGASSSGQAAASFSGQMPGSVCMCIKQYVFASKYIYMDVIFFASFLEVLQGILNVRRQDATTSAWIDVFDSPLQKACTCSQLEIVKQQLQEMTTRPHLTPERLALDIAAGNGDLMTVKKCDENNPRLVMEKRPARCELAVPVVRASNAGHKKVTRYLFDRTPLNVLMHEDGYWATCLLLDAILHGFLDIVLEFFENVRSDPVLSKKLPYLAATKHSSHRSSPLRLLALKPDLFRSHYDLGLWQHLVYNCIDLNFPTDSEPPKPNPYQQDSSKYMNLKIDILKLILATINVQICQRATTTRHQREHGIFIEIIKCNPQLLWISEAVSGRNLFQLAVKGRALLRSLDKDNNNILHIVAYLSPRPDHLSKISGSALEMQREIRWYMEVKSLVSEREVVQKNNEKMTPRQVFEASHEPLRKEGEEWMKYTATACSFVAALIATVTFQAIFTVPGGYDETWASLFFLQTCISRRYPFRHSRPLHLCAHIPLSKILDDSCHTIFAYDFTETFRRSPFKFANTKVPQGGLRDSSSPIKKAPEDEAPNDQRNTNLYYDYIQLSQGISQGRVEVVKDFLNRRPDAVDEWINFYETPLLKACACGKPEIVKELLRRMTPEQMIPKMSQNASYHTPLTVVAVSGNMEIAEVLIAKNPKLLEIPGNNGQIPVVVAVENTQMEMARYLYIRTPVQVLLDEDGYHGSLLFLNAIFYKMLDIALDLFSLSERLAVTKHSQIESIPIIVLASKPDLFPGGCYLGPLERFIYSWLEVKLPTLPEATRSDKDQHNTLTRKLLKLLTKWTGIDEVYRMKVMHLQAEKLLLGISKETLKMGLRERSETVDEALLFAVRFGNVDFLVEMIKNNSELLWSTRTSSSSTLFLLAVEFRQEKVFSLLYGLDDRKHLLLADKDCYGNGVLHLAGYPSPPSKLSNVVGATLQMQRELQWFKEAERIAPEIEKERVNTEEQTPSEIFTKEHESLRKEAEKWMKDTAMSCSLVAALIVTVTFAAVFTVPGGTDDNKKGIPFHLKDPHFVTFVVSDLVSCFASCTSVLIFLGILTARYSFDDFLVSLPTKMIAGLSILFVSIAAMLVAFSSALFTMFYDEKWIVPPTTLLACFPALLFVLLQYPLLKEMIFSTYGKGIFDRNMKSYVCSGPVSDLKEHRSSQGEETIELRHTDSGESQETNSQGGTPAHRRWNSKTRPTLTFINDGTSGEIKIAETTPDLIRAKLYYRTTSISAREEESRRTAKRKRAREKEASGGRTRTNTPEAEQITSVVERV
ncbi:LOW QUALITY PROTEIN: hypothetical protein HID58_044353 [Brassica napus]|uniref:PGG domain-containing protein n=1 Tax=Brassica napus TaxID=3708 RepID=A0ABQ8BJ44_BRANA|nr:LOW QUALITY PROTEIN: hypothetical protein HID58_044353 [Brassica napus]